MTLAQEMLSTAERLKRCPTCLFGGSNSDIKFIAGFAMTERDRELILLALREAALRLNAEVTERMT